MADQPPVLHAHLDSRGQPLASSDQPLLLSPLGDTAARRCPQHLVKRKHIPLASRHVLSIAELGLLLAGTG